MNLPGPLQPYATLITWILRLGAVLALAALVWWAALLPRTRLADARAELAAEQDAHAATRAAHAAVLADIAGKAAAVAAKARAAQDEFARWEEESKRVKADAVAEALARGQRIGYDIGRGSVVVRPQWRDRECPGAAPGAGAGPDAGAAGVPEPRAAAIGRVLGIAGVADATYAEAFRRLRNLQPLIDACFEQPAKAVP